MAEDIIITPASGKIDFYDRNSLLTEWIIENGTFNFKRGGQTYLSMDNTYPNYRVNTNLKVSNFYNNSGLLITGSGWGGSPQPPGPTGAKGNTGITGAQGAVGAQGAIGSQGAQGAQGSQGGQGAQGAVGSQGAIGSQGSQGGQGAQGAKGVQGAQGAQGNVGNTGSQGGQGSQGAVGSQGAIGSQGAQGGQGSQGIVGSQGAIGSQGAQGTTGVQGAQGAQGSQGGQGAQGTTGFQGAQGSQGGIGAQGSQGSTSSPTNIFTPATGSPNYTTYGGYTGWYAVGISSDNPRVNVLLAPVSVASSTYYEVAAIYYFASNPWGQFYLQFNDTGWPESTYYIQPFDAGQAATMGGTVSTVSLGGGWYYSRGTFKTNAATTTLAGAFFDADFNGVVVFFSNITLN